MKCRVVESLIGVAVVFMVLSCEQALAQDNSGVSGIDKAASSWAVKATQAVRERRYEDAVKGFLKVFDISREPSSLYNVAMIYLLRLGQPMRAWEYAMQYSDIARTAKDRRDAARLIARVEFDLQKSRSRLKVIVTPHNAHLWLNDKSEGARMKRKMAWVVPGTYTVFAEARNHDPGKREVKVELGTSSEVNLVLEPHEATLRVVANVKGSRVFLNDKEVGASPTESEIPPGTYVVRVEAEGHQPYEKKIEVEPGRALVMPVKLAVASRPRNQPAHGEVSVDKHGMSAMEIGAWTSVGTGGALAVAGAAVLIKAYLNTKSFPNRTDYQNDADYIGAYDSASAQVKTFERAGWACLGVGVAAVGIGLVLYFTGDTDSGTAVVPTFQDGPGIATIVRF